MAKGIYKSVEEDTEFRRCIAFVFEREGGYVNHPKDKGGETKYGISKRAFPNLDIKSLTKKNAEIIYFKHYWLYDAYQLEWPLNLVHFDANINHGTKQASRFLDACNEDWKKYIELRREFYLKIVERNPKQEVFLKGWFNRLNELKKFIEEQNS